MNSFYDPENYWKAIRPCECGESDYAGTIFPDVVFCYDCGLVYCVAESVSEPVAMKPKKEDSGI